MAIDKTGAPAFPGINPTMTGIDSDGAERFDNEASGGMTLRDYFAAKALQGMLGGEPGSHLIPHNAATEAYGYADAMLAERAK